MIHKIVHIESMRRGESVEHIKVDLLKTQLITLNKVKPSLIVSRLIHLLKFNPIKNQLAYIQAEFIITDILN